MHSNLYVHILAPICWLNVELSNTHTLTSTYVIASLSSYGVV